MKVNPLKEGDVVLVKENNLDEFQWMHANEVGIVWNVIDHEMVWVDFQGKKCCLMNYKLTKQSGND